jgi:RNA polymerase sigma-70 factor (ECF subfamily)
MTDAQLIDKFLEGDINAFNVLVRRWEKSIYNFVLRQTGKPEEAKDHCQEAFIRAYRNLKQLRDPQKFSTWIYRIALNVCRDEMKKRQRRKTFSLNGFDEHEENIPNPGLKMEKNASSDPHIAAQNRDVKALLNRALQSIPEEQRVVIIMKEYQGLKFSEIAETLGISVNTAKSRMYYGLSALKKVFDQWNIDREKIIYEM